MKYEKHELADLFPPMTREERRELRENLKRNGQIDPIITFEKKILEGWHRYIECQELGIEPQFVNYLNLTQGFKGMHPADYVWAKNAERRHLDQSTKARLKIAYEIALGKQFLTHAQMNKRIGDKEKAESAEKEKQVVQKLLHARGEHENKPRMSPHMRKLGIQKTSEQMAKEIGVSRAIMDRAMRLAAEAPRKFNSVAAGRISLHEAISELPLTDRQKKNREERAKRLRQGLILSDTIRTLIKMADKNGGSLYVEVGGYGIQLRKACHIEQDELDRLKT